MPDTDKLELGRYLELQGPPTEVAEAAKYIRVAVEHTIACGPFKDYSLDLLPPAITQHAYRAAVSRALEFHPSVTVKFFNHQVSHIV